MARPERIRTPDPQIRSLVSYAITRVSNTHFFRIQRTFWQYPQILVVRNGLNLPLTICLPAPFMRFSRKSLAALSLPAGKPYVIYWMKTSLAWDTA